MEKIIIDKQKQPVRAVSHNLFENKNKIRLSRLKWCEFIAVFSSWFLGLWNINPWISTRLYSPISESYDVLRRKMKIFRKTFGWGKKSTLTHAQSACHDYLRQKTYFKKLARDRDVIRMTVNAEVTEGRRHGPIKHNHVFDGHWGQL